MQDFPASVGSVPVVVLDTVGSTNAEALARATAGEAGPLWIVARQQSAGHGRRGRTWVSEPGNLYASLLLNDPAPPAVVPGICFVAALALHDAILDTAHGLAPAQLRLKWPNDLLLNGRKVSGILIENSFSQQGLAFSVAGIGLNVERGSFPEALGTKATSLAGETGKKMDRTKLLRRLLTEIDGLYADVRSRRFDRILDEWNSRCTMFGKDITVLQHDHQVNGSAVGLSSEGGLILQTAKGKETVFAGDVTILS